MGKSKDELAREEAKREAAIEVAVRADELRRCEFHEEVTIDQTGTGTPEESLVLADRLWREQDELTSGFSTVEELHRAIVAAVEESPDDCRACDAWG